MGNSTAVDTLCPSCDTWIAPNSTHLCHGSATQINWPDRNRWPDLPQNPPMETRPAGMGIPAQATWEMARQLGRIADALEKLGEK